MITTLKELYEMGVGQKEIVKTCYNTYLKAYKDEYGYMICVSKLSDYNIPLSIYSPVAYIPAGLVKILSEERHKDITGNVIYYMAGYNPNISIKEIITIDKMLGGLLYD